MRFLECKLHYSCMLKAVCCSKEHYWGGGANVSPTTAILTTSTLIREELTELESWLDLETHQLAATRKSYKLYNTFRLRTRSWMCDAWHKRRKRTVCQVKNDYAVNLESEIGAELTWSINQAVAAKTSCKRTVNTNPSSCEGAAWWYNILQFLLFQYLWWLQQ